MITKRLLAIFGLVLVMLLLFPIPVYAIDVPDTEPQMRGAFSYYDLKESGDRGFLVDYYLDYATLPDETVTDAYLVVLVDSSDIQIRSVSPYVFQDSGYGRGLAWIYFTPAEVVSYNITSGGDYKIWLMGNPTLAWSGDIPKTIGTIDYWEPVSGDTASLFGSRVLYFADVLELAWSLDMIESTSIGEKLTTIGESYFVNTISDLRLMAPDIFSAGEASPITDNSTGVYGTDWADQLLLDKVGTPLDFSSMASAWHIGEGALTGMIWLVFMGVVLYPVVQFLGTKVAVLFLDILIAVGALMGMLPWALLIGLGVFATLLTTFILFYKPSSA